VGCYIWYREGTGQDHSPPRPLLDDTNVTSHPSTASVPTTVLLHNGPMLCGFNVPIKRLTGVCIMHFFTFIRIIITNSRQRPVSDIDQYILFPDIRTFVACVVIVFALTSLHESSRTRAS